LSDNLGSFGKKTPGKSVPAEIKVALETAEAMAMMSRVFSR